MNVYRPLHGYAQQQTRRSRWWFVPAEAPASTTRVRRPSAPPSVYRQPYNYAQRHAARIEWQPQPEWSFDCTLASWAWTTYPASLTVGIPCTTAQWAWQTYVATVTVAGDINIACGLAQWAWTGHRSTQASSRQIDCTKASWTLTVYTPDLERTPLLIRAAGARATLAQRQMIAKYSQKRIIARVA